MKTLEDLAKEALFRIDYDLAKEIEYEILRAGLEWTDFETYTVLLEYLRMAYMMGQQGL